MTKESFMKFGFSGQSTSARRTMILAGLALTSILLAFATSIKVTTWEKHESEYLLRTAEQRVVSREIATTSLEAASGIKTAFSQLKDARDYFESLMKELKVGDPTINLPASPQSMKLDVRNMESTWLELRQNADEILVSQSAILSVGEFIEIINEFIPQISELSEEVVDILVRSKASKKDVFIASRQVMLAQRIQNSVSSILEGGSTTVIALDQFSTDAELFNTILNGMLKGDKELEITKINDSEVIELLEEIQVLFVSINDYSVEIIAITPDLLPALEAANNVAAISDKVNDVARGLIDKYTGSPGLWHIGTYQVGANAVTGLGALSLLFLALLAWSLISSANKRQKITADQNERNQEAILKLLDEMGDLADGDLTVTATVSEDITGAIADSVNYAIEALRSLVTTINQTSVQVSASAQETRSTSLHLAEASEHQAEQISSATGAVVEMSTALENLSGDAKESAEVAQNSVDIAGKGASAVLNTIQGMDNIREQIQETSKRIKRLGESSQQIGEIVELIDDISDQTNILALNAAMQAAMAGEAGRGFAVVADEVQRLAERSSNATKQIDALVKTIQADTNEAVASMETSTIEVVSGAKLAEDAGDALKEIENVSKYIADLTGQMATSAQFQADGATQIKTSMSVIDEITTQTKEGIGQAAESINVLVELSNEMNRSVAGFSLPE